MSPFSGVTALATEQASDAVQAASGAFSLMWLLVALPLVGAAVLLLAGRRTDGWGHWLAIAHVGQRVRRGLHPVRRHARPARRRPSQRPARLRLGARRHLPGAYRPAPRPALHDLRAAHHRRRHADPHLLVGYMAHDPDRRRFFAYLNLFVASMLLLVLADNYLAALRRLGGRRSRVLPAHRLLVHQGDAPSVAAKKAFVVNRVGDVGLSLGDHAHVRHVRLGHLRRGVLPRRRGAGRHAHLDRSRPAARGLRQVRAVPAADLAARRDGRPHPGVGAHPRRDDGHRRRLPDRALRPDLRPHGRRAHRGARHRQRSRW